MTRRLIASIRADAVPRFGIPADENRTHHVARAAMRRRPMTQASSCGSVRQAATWLFDKLGKLESLAGRTVSSRGAVVSGRRAGYWSESSPVTSSGTAIG